MIAGRLCKSLIALIVIHLVACCTSASEFDKSAKWVQTQQGSTTVIRATTLPHVDKQNPHSDLSVKPFKIVGFRSIADFVNDSLGFRFNSD